MGWLFAILGSIAALFALLTTLAAIADKGTYIQLSLGGIYWIAAAVFWVGAGIIFRMDDNHSKKDTPK